MYQRRLGILSRALEPDSSEIGLDLPLALGRTRDLDAACLADFLARISKLKKVSKTLFQGGAAAAPGGDAVPRGFSIVRQASVRPAGRVDDALRILLDREAALACVVGSRSPDLPLAYVKRAYAKLKHREVVLGPTLGGGLYLVGAKGGIPGIFDGLAWGKADLLREVLRRIQSAGLACSLLPPWYEVATAESLSLLETMVLARRIEKRDRLHAIERVLETIRE